MRSITHKTTSREAPPQQGRQRFGELIVIGIAAVAFCVALIPTNGSIVRLIACVVIVSVIAATSLFDKRRRSTSASTTTMKRNHGQRARFAPQNGHQAIPEQVRQDINTPAMPSNWLGPFNPDDGLPLEESPHFARYDDIPIPTTFSDSDLLD